MFKKFISFESKDYLLKIKDTVQNLSPEEIKLAAYSKLDRSAEVVESKGSGFTDPSSFAYLGPAFRTEEENYVKVPFNDIQEDKFKQSSSDGWAAILQHYFLSSIVPEPGKN